MSSLVSLLREKAASMRPGLHDFEIQSLAGEFSFPPSDALVALYQLCDGATLTNGWRILPLREALDFAAALRDQGPQPVQPLLPFTDTGDSNPLCLGCTGPLEGAIVHLLHDDVPVMKFRGLDTMARALAADWENAASPEDLEGDFAPDGLTAEDTRRGEALLDAALPTPADERQRMVALAVSLLGRGQLPRLAALLEDEDEYVRQHAAGRLREIGGREADSLLSARADEFARFIQQCHDRLKAHGLDAHLERGRLRVEPGAVWLNMEMFFGRRNRRDFEERFLERVRALVALAVERQRRANPGA